MPKSRLGIDSRGRSIVRPNGEPFFWLADTAWELLHRLTHEEIDFYFRRRVAQGFNTVQMVALLELNGLSEPNRYGDTPFIDKDPARPRPSFFRFLREVVDLAGSRGLTVGLVPTWASFAVVERHPLWESRLMWTPLNARAYGEFLGELLSDLPNVVYLLGGDRPAAGVEATWREMAAGIRSPHPRDDQPILTYHPPGPGSSLDFWPDEPWLDFHMVQSGHDSDLDPRPMMLRGWRHQPVKPILNGEPAYEGVPNRFDIRNGKLNADHVWRASVRSILGGSAGITYGANEVWMMWSPEIEPLTPLVPPPFLHADRTWREALEYPGAERMHRLRNWAEGVDWLKRVPNEDGTLTIGDHTWTEDELMKLLVAD